MQPSREIWQNLFRTKSLAELKEMRPPRGLDPNDWTHWHDDREAAMKERVDGKGPEEPPSNAKEEPVLYQDEDEKRARRDQALQSPKYQNPPR